MGVKLKTFAGNSLLATELFLTCVSAGDPLQIITSKYLLTGAWVPPAVIASGP
jgi:hypothetical protein